MIAGGHEVMESVLLAFSSLTLSQSLQVHSRARDRIKKVVQKKADFDVLL